MIFRVFLGPLLYLVALVVPQSVSLGLDELRDLKKCHCRRMALWLCGLGHAGDGREDHSSVLQPCLCAG